MKNLLNFLLTLLFITSTFTIMAQTKSIQVQTVKSIDAPINQVYDLLRSYDRFPEWSPFLITDPEQKNHVTGNDGEIGSAFHWEGVAEKSLGKQTLTEMKENEYLLMKCDVQKPQKSKGVFEYILTEENGKTVVTQNFSIPCNGFQKFMMGIFGVKKAVTKINILGMERLNELAVKDASMASKK